MKINQIIYHTIIILGFSACAQKQAENTQAEPKQTSIHQVSLSLAQLRNTDIQIGSVDKVIINDEVKANGIVDVPPQNLAQVSALASGYVQSTNILPGSRVSKGQLLAVLVNPDYIELQRDYAENMNKLTFLEQELKRQQELAAENVGAGKKLQQADSDYKALKTLTNALEAKLKLLGFSPTEVRSGHIKSSMQVKAPIGGYIKSANLAIGKYVNTADVMFEIVNKSHMHLELTVFEKDIFKVKDGQRIVFTLPNAGADTMAATVYLVGKVFDPQNRSILVHAHPEPERETLIPGMYVSAKIQTGNSVVEALPNDAIVRDGDIAYIFVQAKATDTTQNRIFHKVVIETGLSQNGFTAVYLPPTLTDRSSIVKKGAYYLSAEMAKNNNADE